MSKSTLTLVIIYDKIALYYNSMGIFIKEISCYGFYERQDAQFGALSSV